MAKQVEAAVAITEARAALDGAWKAVATLDAARIKVAIARTGDGTALFMTGEQHARLLNATELIERVVEELETFLNKKEVT